jgi:hypothetical protein
MRTAMRAGMSVVSARARRAAAPGVLATFVLLAAIVAGACGPVTPPPSVDPGASAPIPTTPPINLPSGSATVGVDGSLLDALPREVGGAVMTEDAETAAGIAADVADDPGLAADLDALAVGLYAGPADYAVVTVSRLRDGGLFGDDYFRDWRDSFDEAVCSQAGGIDGHAEAEIGGRTAYIGTCAGGVRTYHVRLNDPDRMVSLQALGAARYGEQILAGLEE